MLSALISPITGLLDKFIEDKDQKNKLAHDIATLAEKQAHEQVLAQLEVNQAEAKHRSIFVAGWRPAIGWICGAAFAWHFVISQVVVFTLGVTGQSIPELPTFDMGSLMTVLGGMLGLGGLRTYEKWKGVTNK